MVNPNMKTGDIEIELISFEILGKCAATLPFEISHPENASEETRLKYRYLDLRNEKHHNTVLFRSKVIDYIRSLMKEMMIYTKIRRKNICGYIGVYYQPSLVVLHQLL